MRQVILAVLLVAAAACTGGEAPTPTDGVSSETKRLQPNEIYGEIYPKSYSIDGSPINPQMVKDTVRASLLNENALRSWRLCGAELWAEAEIARGSIAAIDAFPQDRPLNNTNPAADEAEKKLNTERAELYEQAASLAQQLGIPCLVAGQALDVGNYFRTKALTDKGDVELAIVDYDVVFRPLEYFRFYNKCLDALEGAQQSLEAQPVDTRAPTPVPLSTFSERTKARRLAQLSAHIGLLRSAGVTC